MFDRHDRRVSKIVFMHISANVSDQYISVTDDPHYEVPTTKQLRNVHMQQFMRSGETQPFPDDVYELI